MPPARLERSVPSEEEVEESRQAVVRDMRTFVGTDAYKELRRRLNQMLVDATPQPGMGMEAAAGCAFRQAGVLDVVNVIDTMVRQAEEKIE